MIGLFGGTFDPIHFGHLRPALDVKEALKLDEVRFIPAHVPPHRDNPGVSSAQRAEMVALAIEDEPGFALDRCELSREGASYSVDTLKFQRQQYGFDNPLVLLLGSDAFQGFTQWHCWQEILQLAHLAVMMRPGNQLNVQSFPDGFLDTHLTPHAATLEQQPAGKIIQIPVTQLAISATDIRSRLQAKRSVRFLMPQRLVDYIHTHRLYD